MILGRKLDQNDVGPLLAYGLGFLRNVDAEAEGVRDHQRGVDLDIGIVEGRTALGRSDFVRTARSEVLMVFFQFALAMSTVLPTWGSIPSASGSLPGDQATSYTFSCLVIGINATP